MKKLSTKELLRKWKKIEQPIWKEIKENVKKGKTEEAYQLKQQDLHLIVLLNIRLKNYIKIEDWYDDEDFDEDDFLEKIEEMMNERNYSDV